MAGLANLEGRTYGPFPFSVTRDRIAAFVSASRDDEGRWQEVAPPGFAAATLFLPAPAFFADPDVAPWAGSVIHADQSFNWHSPWKVGDDYNVAGRVGRIRDRRGVAFVGFTMSVVQAGAPVLDAASTFLMAADAQPDTVDERPEPPALAAGPNDPLQRVQATDGPLPSLARSASRADLVRYAAATSDYNPIHWDHDSARDAGLPGVVCHGLLLATWMFQSAARLRPGLQPLAEAKVRFRSPVLAAAPCRVVGTVTGDSVDLSLFAGDTECVTGRVEVTP